MYVGRGEATDPLSKNCCASPRVLELVSERNKIASSEVVKYLPLNVDAVIIYKSSIKHSLLDSLEVYVVACSEGARRCCRSLAVS